MRRRLAAMIALVAGAATIVAAVAIAVSEFRRGLGLLGCVAVAGSCAWYGVLQRGIARAAGSVSPVLRSPVQWRSTHR